MNAHLTPIEWAQMLADDFYSIPPFGRTKDNLISLARAVIIEAIIESANRHRENNK